MTLVKKREEKILRFWKKEKIYEKVRRKLQGKRKFYFLDGPPYATGSIHMGTALNKILKDCYLRFLRARGYDAWDQPGFDCHGVPIEHKVEERLGFKTKTDIVSYGVERFVKECKKFATRFVGVMSKQFENLGVWMDWKNPYLTLTNDYIESAWFTFKKAFEKGLLFKDEYPCHLCPRCQTVVAYNEIEYEKVEDPAIYVKFPVEGEERTFLVCYTTTPWTIPANTAIMVYPDFEYARVKVAEESLIIAKDLVEKVMAEAGVKHYEIAEVFPGKKLEGIKYMHPLAGLFPFHKKLKNAWKVVLSKEFVSLKEGSGLVHCAPGHGKEDYEVGRKYNLPAPSPVTLDGRFTEECGKFSGKYVKDANKEIIEELRTRGLLFFEGKIIHEYPLCWRCDTPLLLVSIPQWFFKIVEMRTKLIEENKRIKWTPAWAGLRFQNWLESLGDWPISRQRYWGIPLPIWICEKCGHTKVIGSTEELPIKIKDLHKPWIDKVLLRCVKCGGKMKRVEDVLDVWFDSGVAPWASLGYPKVKKLFKKMWPVSFITEGPDQIRGWFNSLLITSFITFGRSSFENVLFHGFVLDAHGVKMSKSRGNVVMPEEVVEKYGRDVLRFYFLSRPPWEDYFFNWRDVEEVARKFVIVRNTFNFIKTYVKKKGRARNLKFEDRWLLSRLNSLIESCTRYFESYQAHKAATELLDFILNDLSRLYIKKIRDRVWPAYMGKDKDAAFFTLSTVAQAVCKLLAPFCPFLAESAYQELKFLNGKYPSIHLFDWPRANKRLINPKLEANMEVAKKILEACSLARQRAGLKLRWPVSEVLIKLKDKKLKEAIDQAEEFLRYMCNAKDVRTVEEFPTGDYLQVDFELGVLAVNRKLDEKLLEEALMRELIRRIQQLRKEQGFKVEQKIILTLDSDAATNRVLQENSKRIADEVGAKKVVVGKLKGRYREILAFQEKRIVIAF